jgi:hypothetical protein
VLEILNAPLLSHTRCFFAGGTRIVLELNEYRESMDIDFMCSDRVGYRKLRSMITHHSFGDLFCEDVELVREIRADMYGVRTILLIDGQPLKFEIISEGRMDLDGLEVKPFPVPVLDRSSCFAEKVLANTDRGRDTSTRARDIVDLAFMSARWCREELSSGLARARDVYGSAVDRELSAALAKFDDQPFRRQCVTELAVSDTRTLNRGLQQLHVLASAED